MAIFADPFRVSDFVKSRFCDFLLILQKLQNRGSHSGIFESPVLQKYGSKENFSALRLKK